MNANDPSPKKKKKNHHSSEGVTRRSINWGLSSAVDQWESFKIMEDESCSVTVSSTPNCTVYTVFLQQGNSFLPSLPHLPEENGRRHLPSSPWWYFDFTFPFPVYHTLIRSPHAVTCSIKLHLLKLPEMLLAIWNIVRADCSSSCEENINVYCSEIKPLSMCQQLSIFSGGGKISPRGISNPPLVCTAAAIQQNKIIPVAAYNLDHQIKW